MGILSVEFIVASFFRNQHKQFTNWLTNSINNNINLFLWKGDDHGYRQLSENMMVYRPLQICLPTHYLDFNFQTLYISTIILIVICNNVITEKKCFILSAIKTSSFFVRKNKTHVVEQMEIITAIVTHTQALGIIITTE